MGGVVGEGGGVPPPLDWQFLVPCLHCVAQKLWLLFHKCFRFFKNSIQQIDIYI